MLRVGNAEKSGAKRRYLLFFIYYLETLSMRRISYLRYCRVSIAVSL